MSYRYMLDTNIISDLVKNPRGKVAVRISEVGSGAVCTSAIVACELQFGAAKRGVPELSERIETSLVKIPILSLTPEVRYGYGSIRNQLERRGQPISPNDFLIAAHALTLDLILVTANLREFERVEGLRVENWL